MVTASEFRQAMGRFATGLTVVTVRTPEGIRGMTANAFASVSLDPPLVLVCVEQTSHTHRRLERSGSMGVNVLTRQQRALSRRFAGGCPPGGDAFEGIETEEGPYGTVLIAGSLASLSCRVVRIDPAGDHSIFLGEVVQVRLGQGEPLVYYRGELGRFRPNAPLDLLPYWVEEAL